MATIIAVRSALMQKLYTYCEEESKRVQTCFQQTQDMMDDLRANGWKAPAADKFYAEMENHTLESTRRLAEAIESTGVALSQINDIVVNADEEASDYLRGGV